MKNLLELIIIVSEKAANVARSCRQNKNLFSLLIQEKKSDEANIRFSQDFKTLADVLIQETVRHDIEKYFPVLGNHIQGEESNVFTNVLGETIEIKICSDKKDTATLLEKVLDGNSDAATILADEVHKNILITDVKIDDFNLPNLEQLDINNLGIWIDPIDSTAEYIEAKEQKDSNGVHINGLRCVTVLIGVFNKLTGVPIMGVVNQPFYQLTRSGWEGKCFWGLSTTEQSQSSLPILKSDTKLVTLSRIELDTIKIKLEKFGYKLVLAAGAGYKLLNVITGVADAYIVSQGTTFRWDICGPQAILTALGGGVYDYSKLSLGQLVEIDYKDVIDEGTNIQKYCNKNGLIAVRNKDTLVAIMKLLLQ